MVNSLEHPVPKASDEEVLTLAGDLFGLTGSLVRLESERDLNALISSDEERFVFKIANAAEPIATTEMQSAALEHIAAGDPTMPVPRVRRSKENRLVETATLNGVEHAIQVVSYLAGTADWHGPTTPALGATIGTMLARLQRALRGFFHPAGGRALLWDARSTPQLLDWVPSIEDRAVRRVVRSVFERFGDRVLPKLAHLPAQFIHNDFHRGNLLTDADPAVVGGVIDFGDMIHGTRVQDVAVACAYASLGATDPLEGIRPLLSAFCDRSQLLDEELDVIGDLVGVRFAQSVTIGSWRASRLPPIAESISGDADGFAAELQVWLSLNESDIRHAIREAAGMSPLPDGSDRLQQRRAQALSPGLRLSYAEPLHLVGGEGVRLFDAHGRTYLDAYNNVPQVGHANRRVANAINQQMRRLNTNTRYLTDAIVDYGELLASQLPDPLEVCFFVNSGSEANDLAWRIAKSLTGGTGVVVTENAYHGWTDALIAMSPEEVIADREDTWMATVPPPGGDDWKSQADAAIVCLDDNGHRPAALFIDTTFSSDGIHDVPPGYLTDMAQAVRNAGGIFVADEVQAGLGRVGERFWGFAGDQIVPDIVTLGKPLGNGYPIGAVVTTAAIAEAFCHAGYFFSTFGGNPVAAAAASMVLKITLAEELAARAERIGHTIRSGLVEALETREMRGIVRGPGSFIGVDLGSRELAERIVDEMYSRRVLIGRTGPGHDVLKIRPPLVFDEQNADELLEAFSDSLDALG